MIGCNTKVPYQKFKLNHPPVISPSKMSYGKEHHPFMEVLVVISFHAFIAVKETP